MLKDDDPAKRLTHDAEETMRKGMSEEAREVDEAETLASTGDLESSFREIASGTATGIGLDREETALGSAPVPEADRAEFLGSAANAFSNPKGAPPDDVPLDGDDQLDGDDSWLQDLPRDLR